MPLPVVATEPPLTATVIVGTRPGPQALVVGGVTPGDVLGLAVVEAVARAVEPDALAGTLVAFGLAAADALAPRPAADLPDHLGRWVRALLGGDGRHPAFVLEVRAGASGWATCPHIRADLRHDPTRRLARAFGVEVVVDSPPARRSLRGGLAAVDVPALLFEGGELGRSDAGVVALAARGVLHLLADRRMLERGVHPPPWRAIVDTVTRVRARRAGLVVPLAVPGTLVRAGEPLLGLFSPTGARAGTVTAPKSSVVLALPLEARVRRDAPVARLGHVRASVRVRPSPGVAGKRTVGWCEWVALPELGVPRLRAKIDTGARSCALHVLSIRELGVHDGAPLLELRLPVGRSSRRGDAVIARARVADYVVVRDSGGHAERRPVIETSLVLGTVRRRVRVTLTDRGDMSFPMLIGRTALGAGIVVDASARYLLGDG